MPSDQSARHSLTDNRQIRVFVSSAFRDMIEERDALMTLTWPKLVRLCHAFHVELVYVDTRWGVSESQSARKESLALSLDELRSGHHYFIGLLGERYGWIPGDDALTEDLVDEQPYLKNLPGRSATELEIFHGVLNKPDMAGRAFFYFRDPSYALSRGPDFLSDNASEAGLQTALKERIRTACAENRFPLRENYPDPANLAALVFNDLKAAIKKQFLYVDIPDSLTRAAQNHGAFADSHRHTYIGRTDHFHALDLHASGDGGPLLLIGDSGCGKSALLANWAAHRRETHPKDIIVQHYVDGTSGSDNHWQLMTRVMGEIKRWSGTLTGVPTKRDDILRDFPFWLTKAKERAESEGIRFILILDAINQLDDRDHARLLGWLPEQPFTGPLRLIASSLPDRPGSDFPPKAIQRRYWQKLRILQLTEEERRGVIASYLTRFGKPYDERRWRPLIASEPAASPLYLKTLLEDLFVAGTEDRLGTRLTDDLAAANVRDLLRHVLARYQSEGERDCKALVAEALRLIYLARRGLSESELLHLLRPADQPQLPSALWLPIRAAMKSFLVNRGGILNFSSESFQAAIETALTPDGECRESLRLRLADYFEGQPITARSCDELPWLLWQIKNRSRLRVCLLNIDRFLELYRRDRDELMRYWVFLKEKGAIGRPYLDSFEVWSQVPGREVSSIIHAANELAFFLQTAELHDDAEVFYRRTLTRWEDKLGTEYPIVATILNNLAVLLKNTDRLPEAEPLLRRALAIDEAALGLEHPTVASDLCNLAMLYKEMNRLGEVEPLVRRALAIDEKELSPEHPTVATDLKTLASLLKETGRLMEAEPFLYRALAIEESNLGPEHPNVVPDLKNLAQFLKETNQLDEAESLLFRALAINEANLGTGHPSVSADLKNLAQLLTETNRLREAESLLCRALANDEANLGTEHPEVAADLNSIAQLLKEMNRRAEAENLMSRAVMILEAFYHNTGCEHPLYQNYQATLLAIQLSGSNKEDCKVPLFILILVTLVFIAWCLFG